ncbi:uncharacterized protein LOC109544485 isoform X2 [Dendroctonus ponderosae]|uniref:uncharacterized protein LOC109544488 isoform X2 n=1 Tax=Dendroctonus ponderosae TaxID=77166 RepID=UPI0020358BF1|nr:uncharacterized protein LOC109544488 isoform X2 [Dendroctonus ponderosae]XP_048520190.1 uncharacterized protein LOC109544485 isoform X2 [Dendroctonus ponderosae]
MWTIHGILLASVWTLTTILVDGIQVPNKWKQEVAGNGFQSNGQNYAYPPTKQQLKYNTGIFSPDNIQYSPFAPLAIGKLYIGKNSSPSNSIDIKNVKPGLSALPQYSNSQEALSAGNTQQNSLPPLRNPRYPIGQNSEDLLHKSDFLSPNRLKYLESLNGDDFAKNQNLPNNVLKIKPAIIDPISQLKQSGKPLSQFAQVFDPERFKNPTQSISPSLYSLYVPNAQLQPSLKHALDQHVPQQHKFIVSASEADSNQTPLDLEPESQPKAKESTSKEPVFFVTEGYRNVLVQGPNNKKAYLEPQIQKKGSKKIFKEDKPDYDGEDDVEEDDEDEDDEVEPVPAQRKVTKGYSVKDDKEDEDDSEGFSRNSLKPDWEKPTGYFDRPLKYFDEDKKSRFAPQLKTNYRDDTLHEPENDADFDRDDDDDDDRITEDEEEENDDEDDEKNVEENTKESGVKAKVSSPILDEPELKVSKDSKQENNKSEASEAPSEEEENDEKPVDEETEGEEANEEVEQVDDKELKLVDNEHAEPKPIPTKPIYPGQGLWAKPGLKHTPHITQHRFLKPMEDEIKPDGYDVFEDLERFFQKQKVNYGNAANQNVPVTAVFRQPQPQVAPVIKAPNLPNSLVVYDPFNDGSRKISKKILQPFNQLQAAPAYRTQRFEANRHAPVEREFEETTTEFVPSRLYAQVRKSEDVAHEPRNPAKHGRLKEVIKDSKVQTVYSEEGYEDAAYDHAGHEKKAEEDKAYSQFQRAKQGKGNLNEKRADSDAGGSRLDPVVSEPPKELLSDSLTSESEYLSPEEINEQNRTNLDLTKHNSTIKNENVNNFISTKETRTTQVKDKDNGDIQLEIESEVKVIMQPNNSTKAHKFVKIYPKVLKELSVDSYRGEDDDDDDDSSDHHDEDDDDDDQDENGGFKNYLYDSESGNSAEDDGDKYFLFAKNNNTLNSSESLLNSDELRNPINNSQSNSSEILSKIFPSTTESSTVSDIEAMTKETILNNTNTRTNSSKDGQILLEETQGINLKREKRSSDSYEDVEIDTDFIDKINHTFAPAVTEGLDLVKYPYYRKAGVNKDSPLRYAETTKNIPIKKAGELSFYNMADQFPCPDLPQDIDPVPERIQNARTNEDIEESEDEDEDDDESVVDRRQPKKVRIELGDKIDCLKLRYFGENPLDNPLFKETAISPVKSIFKELERKPRQKKSQKPADNSFNPSEIYEQINEIFSFDNKNDDDFGTGLNDKLFSLINTPTIEPRAQPHRQPATSESAKSESASSKSQQPAEEEEGSETITTPNSLMDNSLITTPKYTIQLTPNNIYDQIKLLDHLPGEEEFATGKVQDANAATARDRMDEPDESISPNIEIVQTVERTQNNEGSKPQQRDPRVLPSSDATATVPSVNSERETSDVLEPEAWRRQRVMSEVFYKEEIKPSEQLTVFADILNNIKNSTNNEKVSMQSSSNFAEPGAVTISSLEEPTRDLERTKLRVKKFQTDSSNGQNDFGDKRPDYKSPSRRPHRHQVPNNIQSSSNHQPNIAKRPVVHRPNQNNIEFDLSNFSGQSDDPLVQSTLRPEVRPSIRKVLKRRRKPTTSTTSVPTTTTTAAPKVDIFKQKLAANHKPYVIDYIEDVEQVIGLVPPQSSRYRTIIFDDPEVGGSNKVADQIYDSEGVVPSAARDSATAKQPAPVTEVAEEVATPRQLNKYYFVGLKPPANQRAMSYSEFTNNNLLVNDNLLRRRVAHVGYLRDKRNAARPSYADLSRNRGRQSEAAEKDTLEDDADDYVPHRPTNYHYDEKTGKIVYHSKPEQAKSEEDDEEYEELEVKDVPGIYLERAEGATHPTKEKVTTKPLLATATPPPEGKGLLDFVVQLKNDKKYTYIPDPTTAKPGDESVAAASVTVDPKTTDPPEFLSILSKVKNDKTYKFVEDPKESQSKQKAVSTTASPESNEDDEEEEESEEESAGKPRPTRQITNLKIFNIGDFLPKIQTPVSSPIPTNVFKKQVVERIFPRLQYMTPYDIAREYYKQTELYKLVKKLAKESPKRQSLADLQIFDIGDYLPTIRPIDYSKYKTIERPRTRPQPEEEGQSEVTVVTRRPSSGPGGEPAPADRRRLTIEEKESVDTPVVSEEKVGHDKKHSVSSQNRPSLTTTQRILQLRRGTRPTSKATKNEERAVTRRTFNRYRPAASSNSKSTRRTTTRADFDDATEGISKSYPEYSGTERDSSSSDKARRVYRRRPVRIKSTTQKQEVDDEDDESDHGRVRRNADSIKEPPAAEHLEDPSFDATYQTIKKEIINGDDTDSLDYEFGDKAGSESKREIVTVQPDNVEVIDKDYDKDRKHGGNYRRESEEDTDEVSEPVDTADVKHDPEAETPKTDLKDAETVRDSKKLDVEVVDINYDKAKKHGGNYKESKDTSKNASQLADEDEEVQSITDNYEKTKLRAGGFRSRSSQNINQKDETEQKDTTTDSVQIINENYDKTKKHGGNYKSQSNNEEEGETVIAADETRADAKIVEEKIPVKPADAVIDIKNLDPAATNPNPDSYSKPDEEDSPIDEYQQADKEIADEAEEGSDFSDPIEETDFTDDPFEENIHSRRYLKPETTTAAPLKIVSRLSDVIPKPDHFYSDPQLPTQINKLGSEKVNVKLASEELDQLAVEGDVVEEIHRPQRRGVEIGGSYFDNDHNGDRKDDGKFEEETLGSSTEKPLFEKDPSKRLYFYLSD